MAGTSPTSPRWIVFVHQDGLLLSATLRGLDELGILEPSLGAEASLAELYPELTPGGFGYLRVGLRCLASQGWLEDGPTLDPDTTVLRWTDAGRAAAAYFDRYVQVGEFLAGFPDSGSDAWSRPWGGAQSEAFLELLPLALAHWEMGAGLPEQLSALITTHLDAGLVVPAMLSLRAEGRLSDEGPVLPDSETGRGIGALLAALGWMDHESGGWTPGGSKAQEFSVHFGMAASYLPLLARLPDLYRGKLVVAPEAPTDFVEWHVNRGLNVNASAAAHKRYFANADSIFAEIFDREPVEDQPRFVDADMGCGDGSWLVHLHELITKRTLRGQRIRTDPVLMVGLDYSAAALEQARHVVDAAGVPALLVHGDISDPDRVQATLSEHGLEMSDGLHVRAFIDHDRGYLGGDPSVAVRGWSSGAYVGGKGEPIAPADVERDLVAHLARWAPHVHRHGLVMLEAHCVAPEVGRRHLGATHSVAFDAYHGYSHQYPVEHSAFRNCCRQAGLQPASYHERRYPASRPFVAVSLNRLVVPDPEQALPGHDTSSERQDTWQPDPATDLEDGRALHGLLFHGGDIRYPRQWCSAPTGFVVSQALDVVDARLNIARRGDVIRVLDYGAGTGLATIEFLKACRERRFERRLEDAGVTLEVHLVDIPSSWFAQGFELLSGCSWTRFHSLRGVDGGFRDLLDVTGGKEMDVVMANMVFHLIPDEPFRRLAADFAKVMKPGARLIWNAPDLGPAGPYAVLFHDANRELRKRWLELLAADGLPGANLDDGAMAEAQRRADRRVLPQARDAGDVVAALDRHFMGEVEFPTHEILADELLDTLLVPSNQDEYLSEISDRDRREPLIRDLLLGEVVPAMQRGPAGTAVGLNVQWTLGSFTKGP